MPTANDKSFEQPIAILWPKLLLGMLMTGMCALSVHVFLFTYLHNSYPYDAAHSGFLVYVNYSLQFAALVTLYSLAAAKLNRLPAPLRTLLVFVLTTMMLERLIRAPLMNAVDGGD